MSFKMKNLIKDIFQENFIYLLDIYDKYITEIGQRNRKLEIELRLMVKY